MKSILKATKNISEKDLLARMGDIAQHSKKERQLREAQEQRRKEKEKQEAIEQEILRQRRHFLLDKSTENVKKMLDEKIMAGKNRIDEMMEKDLETELKEFV